MYEAECVSKSSPFLHVAPVRWVNSILATIGRRYCCFSWFNVLSTYKKARQHEKMRLVGCKVIVKCGFQTSVAQQRDLSSNHETRVSSNVFQYTTGMRMQTVIRLTWVDLIAWKHLKETWQKRQWPMKCWYGSSSSDIRHFNPRIFAEPDRIYWWEGWKMTRDELCFALGDQQIKLPSNLSCYTGDSGKLVKT